MKAHGNFFDKVYEKLRIAKAEGKNVLDLSIGDPDLPPPEFATGLFINQMHKEHIYTYPQIYGENTFKETISDWAYRKHGVSVLDILLSGLAIIILALPMLIVSIIIKIDSPGPVLFRQKRVGRRKKYFTILKFRSMPVSAPHDTPTHELENAESLLSRWQRFMRRSSIDELPQLFNIFIGQMSIIGPRPALWNQYDLEA